MCECSALLLALYLAGTRDRPGPPDDSPGAQRIFLGGGHSNAALGLALNALIERHRAEIDKMQLGAELGTHPLRKGPATMGTSGSTAGPGAAAACHRGGWSLGGALNRYMKYGGAAGQYLGRALAGLPINDARFMALPPHFCGGLGGPATFDRAVAAVFGASYPASFKPVLSRCLATMAHHADELQAGLPADHKVLGGVLFTTPGMLAELKPMVTNKAGAEPRPTGAPPHAHNFDKLEKIVSLQGGLLVHQRKLTEGLVEQSAVLVEKMHSCLGARAVDNGHITVERLQAELAAAARGTRGPVLEGVGVLIAEKLQGLRAQLPGPAPPGPAGPAVAAPPPPRETKTCTTTVGSSGRCRWASSSERA